MEEELSWQVHQALGVVPTEEQESAVSVFVRFVADPECHAVMVMCGAAGTGKTTVAGAIVRAMVALKQKVMLLAPTGRAAKVFALNRHSLER